MYDKFDKYTIKSLRDDLQAVLDQFQADHGVEIKLGNITYDHDSFKSSVTGLVEGAMPRDQKDYLEVQFRKGLPRLGSIVRIQGTMYQIVGWKKRASKRPIKCIDMSGEHWVMPVSLVVNAQVIAEGEGKV